jgi:hypothetical protein
VLPHQPIALAEDYPAQHLPVITLGLPVRQEIEIHWIDF